MARLENPRPLIPSHHNDLKLISTGGMRMVSLGTQEKADVMGSTSVFFYRLPLRYAAG